MAEDGVCLYILCIQSIWEVTHSTRDLTLSGTVVLSRATQSTQWACSTLEKSSEPMKNWKTYSLPRPKNTISHHQKRAAREQRVSFTLRNERAAIGMYFTRDCERKWLLKENREIERTRERESFIICLWETLNILRTSCCYSQLGLMPTADETSWLPTFRLFLVPYSFSLSFSMLS